ncbi:MAG: hypothetical protein EON91_12815, partial [Brevundimonas sp.]|uniref:beta strand repeat-containing protein n=1 Tax=Brevundimonas sp. TaxID=1871086 RepID=UPI001223040A
MRPFAPKTSLARILLATTALGGALGVIATTAQAADECGAPVNGVVTCAASGSPYGEISYVDQTNLKVNLDPGVEAGSLWMIGTGALELDAGEGVAISASGTNVTAVRVASLEGSAKVAVDTVAVTGGQVYGVLATANQAVNLTARTVTASGREAFGIQAYSTHGDVDVKVGTVEVTSNHASAVTIGISTQARGGKSVNIEVDSVVARATMVSPNGTAGITVDAATRATIKANNVEAYGRAAKGVVFYGTSNDDGVVAADVGRVVVDGENAAGLMFGASTDRGYFDTISAIVDEIQVGATGIGVRIYGGASSASAEWANDLDIGLITGLGSGVEADVDAGGSLRIRTETIDVGGTGIRVVAGDSRTLIDSGSIETSDDNAPGIHVYDTENVAVDAVSITTAGYQSHGMLIDGVGAATLKTGTVSTTGEAAVGVWVLDTDQIVVDLGDIATTGDGSHGAVLRGNTVTGRMDSIVTRGVNANGLMLGSMLGGTVEVGSIHTYGSNSAGLSATIGALSPPQLTAAQPLLRLDVGSVRTEGESATAVALYSVGSEIVGRIETIETTGDFSEGYFVAQEGGAITDMTLGSVTTHGDESSGLDLWVAGGELSVATRSVTTHGDFAYGATLQMLDGSADIAFDTVGTAGRESHGILVTGSQGAALVRANSVTTTGYDADGVVLAGEDAMRMTAELGSVTTTGDNANAITSLYQGKGDNSEALSVKAGTVTTSGANSTAVNLYAADLTVDIGRITTTGDFSAGAFLNNFGTDDEAVSLRGRIGVIDTSGEEALGLVIQHYERFDLGVGAIHTRGQGATGVLVSSATAAGGKLVVDAILTEGDDAKAADLDADSGGYDVTVDMLETRGDRATGVTVTAGDDSSITVGAAKTRGDHADGVHANILGSGALGVTAEDIRTTGAGSAGVRVAADEIDLKLGYIDVAGADADAVVANSHGKLTLAVTRRLGSAGGVAAYLTGETVNVTLGSTSVVAGGSGGLLLSASEGSTITNGGSISSANGYAIEAEAGAVTLNNSGLVSGRVRFSSADDVVNNAGRFTADGDSVFGAGDDVFNNTGVIDLAAGVTGAEFVGLERLNNSGVIDLTNSVAGDVFTLDGVLNGQTGGRIGL